jgi:signal transduction histidine kinase
MSPFEQLARLLSEQSGSIAYHLLTLFAVQATLAIALWQWRRTRLAGRSDSFARRLLIASSGLLLLRLAVALIALYLSSRGDAVLSLRVLPPLELAMNAFSMLLIVWALLRPPPTAPHPTDVLAILFSLLFAILFFSFFWSWQQRAAIAPTLGSEQAIIWNMLQLGIAGGGIVWLLATVGVAHPLPLLLLAVLSLAYLLQLWSSLSVQEEASPDWIRLGYLVALPLLTVIAYRHVLSSLLDESQSPAHIPPAGNGALPLALKLLEARSPAAIAAAAVPLVLRESGADGAAVALLGLDPDAELTVFSGWPGAVQPLKVAGWSLDRWPIIRQVVEQRRQLEMPTPDADAGQMAEIAASIGLRDPAELVVASVDQGRLILGVIVVGYRSAGMERTANWQRRLDLCRRIIVHAIVRVPPVSSAGPSAAESTRLANLAQERDNALVEAATLRAQLQQLEARPPVEDSRIDEIVDNALNAGRDTELQEQVDRLQREVTALRQTLSRSGAPAAGVAMGDAGSNVDWLVETIDRYSSRLETAWARVHELEQMTAPSVDSDLAMPVAALARGLRTPLTSLFGWTTFLADSAGGASPGQVAFVQRVADDVERMESTVRQLVDLAGASARGRADGSLDTLDEVETAIERVLPQAQDKRLLLQLEIEPTLPPAALPQNELRRILAHLLNNACRVTPDGGRVALSVHTDAMESYDQWPAREKEQFLHLEIRDGGEGIQPAEVTRLLENESGTSAALAELVAAQKLVTAAGGRLWAAREDNAGNIFSLLLPIYPAATADVQPQWTGR